MSIETQILSIKIQKNDPPRKLLVLPKEGGVHGFLQGNSLCIRRNREKIGFAAKNFLNRWRE